MPNCLRWGGMASLLGGLGDRFPQHNRELPSKSPAACGGDLYYGSYEPRAIDGLAQKYQTDCAALKNRLVNLNACVYGKVYFPTRSNNLKELGKLVGASWTAPDASGLQSLVWRHHWEETGESQYREMLVTYNREDCE